MIRTLGFVAEGRTHAVHMILYGPNTTIWYLNPFPSHANMSASAGSSSRQGEGYHDHASTDVCAATQQYAFQ